MRLDYQRNGKQFQWPMGEMSPGDHFIVPRRLHKRATSAAYMYGKRHGITFHCRAFGTKGRTRIWRRES